MFAFNKDKHTAERSVIIEKKTKDVSKYLSEISKYVFEKYDTIEVIKGENRIVGLLSGSGYRGGPIKKRTEKTETKTIGYSSVTLIIGTNLINTQGIYGKTIHDDTYNNLIVYINPCKIVLIEKNIVGAYEKARAEYHIWLSTRPLMGG